MKRKIHKLFSVVMSVVMIVSTLTVLTGLTSTAADDAYTITKSSGWGSTAANLYNDLENKYGENILKGKSVYARQSYYTSTLIPKEDTDSLKWSTITNGAPKSDGGVIVVPTIKVDVDGGTHDIGQKWYFDLSALTEIEQITIFNHVANNNDLQLCDFEIYVANDAASLWNEANKVVDYTLDTAATDLNDFNNIQILFSEKPLGKYLGFYWPLPCEFRTKNKTELEKDKDCNFVRLTEIAAFGKQVNTITATAGEGGAISPSGTQTVQNGSNATYTITPDSGYNIKDVLVDGVSVGAVSSYTFENVTENHTITASFTSAYTITKSSGWGSTAANLYNDLENKYGENILKGKSVYARQSYYTSTLIPKEDTDSLKWSTITNGAPKSDGGVIVVPTIKVDVDGGTHDIGQKWYFDLSALTEIEQITIFNHVVSNNDLQLCDFEIYVANDAASLWNEANKVVDYTLDTAATDLNDFNNIQILFSEKPLGKYLGFYWPLPCEFRTKNKTELEKDKDCNFVRLTEIAAFGNQINTITATAGNGGTISPSGETSVNGGEDAVYTITANNGSYISKLLVDGAEVSEAVGETEYTYTFSAVSANHTISVEFFTPYSFTNEFVSKDNLPSKYTDLLNENGENLLSSAVPYGPAENLDRNFVDKTGDWGSLIDGDTHNGPWEALTDNNKRVLRGYKDRLYFEFDNIVDLDKLVIFNYFASMRDGLQIANFDVFVGNNADTLWDESNVVATYNASQVSASGNAKVITLDFNQDGLAKGKYLGICWKAPYNFENTQSVVLTEIAAFGTELDTVIAEPSNGGTVLPLDAKELTTGSVEYTFTPDPDYKIVDVKVDGVSKGVSDKLTITADGESHKVEAEFAIIGDIDNNRKLDLEDVSKLRKHLLGIDICEKVFADANQDGDVDISDLVFTDLTVVNAQSDKDITMLADGLGLDYFGIQDALERGDDLNNISNVNTARVQQVMQKALKGEEITISVIGGSITEGAYNSKNSSYASNEVNKYFGNMSYAEWVEKWFEDTFYNGDTSKVNLVNAGIGATPSLLGSFRLQSMVLDKNPDLVIVEFSCNDFSTIAYTDSDIYLGEGAYEAYESIVRRCLEDDVAVMQLFMGHTQERGLWTIHRVIGSYYNVPMVSFENAVYPNNSCIIGDTTRVYYDGIHPNNIGHAFVGKVISNYLDKIYADTDSSTDYIASVVPTECVYGDTYANANNTILYACDNQEAATGSFAYSAKASSKWGGAYVADGNGEGTITATIPAGVKRVYVLYSATATGSFTTTLGGYESITTDYKSEGRASWSTAYSGEILAEDTTITLTSSSSGLNVIGFMLQY